MNRKIFAFFTSAALLILLGGFISINYAPAPPPKVISIKIQKVEGTWRVMNAETADPLVKANRKDTIVWEAEGTDVSFQFNNSDLFNPVKEEDALVDGYTKYVKAGKKFKLKIKDDAPFGEYPYSVFCFADQEFAKGFSPPRIIIEDKVMD